MDRQKVAGVWYLENSRFRVEVYQYKTGNLNMRFGAHVFENQGGVYRAVGDSTIPPQSSVPEALVAAEERIRDWRANQASRNSSSKPAKRPVSPWARFVQRWAALLLVSAVLIPVTLAPPYANGPPIRSDGIFYHIWTRAILERDLSFCKWTEFGWAWSGRDPSRGVCRNKYPMGLALLRFPIMAPLVDLRPGAPLISRSEHEASLICGAVALALVVWLLLSSSYLLGAPVWAANFSALAFVFGTGLFHYGTYDSSFTHIYSALGLTLLVWLGLRSRKRMPPAVTVAAIAVTCFFLTAIRNTNLIAILFLLAAASPMPWGGDKRRLPTLRWRVSAAALVGIVAAIILNLAYNYYATHHLSFSTYGDESFFFSRPMQWSVLFSYQRGLLTYYPVLAVGLVAGFWTRRTRLAALWLSGLIAGFVTLYGFWASWFLGGGMGHRGFVELMPLAAIIFAVSLPDLPLERRKPIIILAAAFSFLTLEIMCGYWAGTFPFSDATREVYWSHVAGKNSLLPFQ